MKSAVLITTSAVLFLLAGTFGCNTGSEPVTTEPDEQAEVVIVEEDQQEATAEEYPIRGTVKAVNRDEPAVTLDHEEIEGFMAAMTMEFEVENPQLLEGVEEGGQVEGRLVKKDGKYVIAELSERQE